MRYHFPSIGLCSDSFISKCIGESDNRLYTEPEITFSYRLMNLQTLEKCLEINYWSFKEITKDISKDKVFK